MLFRFRKKNELVGKFPQKKTQVTEFLEKNFRKFTDYFEMDFRLEFEFFMWTTRVPNSGQTFQNEVYFLLKSGNGLECSF